MPADCRFDTLYDKMYRADVLWVAYRRCLINDGAPGIDGQTFEDIEEYGQKRWFKLSRYAAGFDAAFAGAVCHAF